MAAQQPALVAESQGHSKVMVTLSLTEATQGLVSRFLHPRAF